ncbi:MAG: peptidylprolyl isomerase, partial [Lachnospiraceae bacterium]|nr:peptidylprolyl isomerase [Lachnospiraceae bacterium]
MRVAVTYDQGNVFGHFGRTEQFKVYDIEDGKVVSSEVVGTNGTGHGALAGLLMEGGVNILICGGIGGGAMMALDSVGIKVYAGASGNTDECVAQLLAGTLPQVGEA